MTFQYLTFSRNKGLYTDLNFYVSKVRLTDGLVHA